MPVVVWFFLLQLLIPQTAPAEEVFAFGPAARFYTALDGNTIALRDETPPLPLAINDLAAPRLDQPGGAQARARLQLLLDSCSIDILRRQQRSGRLVADVAADNRLVAYTLIEEGLAWFDRPFPRDNRLAALPFAGHSLYRLEQEARRARRGLWAAPAIPPWDWPGAAPPR